MTAPAEISFETDINDLYKNPKKVLKVNFIAKYYNASAVLLFTRSACIFSLFSLPKIWRTVLSFLLNNLRCHPHSQVDKINEHRSLRSVSEAEGTIRYGSFFSPRVPWPLFFLVTSICAAFRKPSLQKTAKALPDF